MYGNDLKQLNRLDELEFALQKQLKFLINNLDDLEKEKIKEEIKTILVMFNKIIDIERKLELST